MQAVTLDFYQTLVYPRAGKGRGQRYLEYLSAAGLTADPWEHRVLYDVFAYYGDHYDRALTEAAKRSFWTEFTRRLFCRTGVRGPGAIDPAAHATAVRDIMGPGAFALFDESLDVLRGLRKSGLRLGVISDWQRGLSHFCHELGIGPYVEVVVASGEVGYEKPDPRLFGIARDRLGLAAREILHVGDRMEDVEGARAAGFAAALLARDGEPGDVEAPVLTGLRELLDLVGQAGDGRLRATSPGPAAGG